MDSATLLGLLAGTCTTISFLPQIMKAWKSKSTHDISTGMYVILLWTLYGFILHSLPVIVANVVGLALSCSVLLLKIRHG
jgi:MtN3 and saliva related transmembrane protein